ncbi:LIM domain kinase 2 [Holothuria leucospilota]|uniref:LIM domain kinase 2 n=1 Tax=Holothuria leucospilota TaxID=206669 RepID=A0A9Q1CEM6_HOLLE|nr:LIM domain kinase 2 [Holothuria leucospilota]
MCKKTLSTWYYERDRRLFCREDYFRKFAQGCHGCAYLITGPVMVSIIFAGCKAS